MLAFLTPNDSITAVLSSAVSTAQPSYQAVFESHDGFPQDVAGSLNDTTAVTVVSAPVAGQRKVSRLHFYNADSAAVVITVKKVQNGTAYTLCAVTLQAGDTLRVDDNGVRVTDSTGMARIVRTGYTVQVGTRAKVGATSGWTVGAANDLGTIATLAAGQTGATLVIPLDGLHIGDTITAFKINGQIESAGNTVTVDGQLRALTNAAGDPTDAQIAAMTQVSVTADNAMAQAKTGLSEVVTSGKTYYLLVTATTGASCDIQLLAPEIVVTKAD